MKTATVADLRNNFRRVSSWLEHGETVQIVKRGRPFAQLTALSPKHQARKAPKPDVMARLKEVWGDRVFSLEEVEEMRAAEREGEEG
ncbi:MAG: prevent-host-death protein [Verrucomicrobia bacterium]|jgi:antitoxin (DNA-binding transcriptional repressor) of toxin-antitoxin stability system|nr:prevent-host-death protein [Verrucomicrobiota bacterium]